MDWTLLKIFVDSDCDNGGREGESLAKEAMPMQLSALTAAAEHLKINDVNSDCEDWGEGLSIKGKCSEKKRKKSSVK